MRVPSLTPAGILTVYRLVRRSRPEPPQRGQGSSITVPLPRQRGQGCDRAKNPWLSATTPRPWHSGQIFGVVPGFAPEPWHSEHAVSSVTGIFVSTPLRESSKERLTCTSTSLPRWAREVRPPARPPPRISYADFGVAVAIRFLRTGYDDPCGPQDPVAEPIALLQDLDHAALFRLGGLREKRLVHVWVELAIGLDLGKALPLERGRELTVHQPHALLELDLLVL